MVSVDLYLASQSPRRREILAQLGVRFEVLSIDVEEVQRAAESAAAYVGRLALDKARYGERQRIAAGLPAHPVLGADTVVVCDDLVMEKPRDQNQAMAMWRRLSGRTHQVLSAVAIVAGTDEETELSVTEVQFRPLSDELLARYWVTGEAQDKAGGYGIQGKGAALVKSLSGSYSGVVGLPIEKVIPLLEQFNVPYWQQESDRNE